MRRPGTKRSPCIRGLLWTALVLILALLAAGLYGYTAVQRYIKSDAFRLMLAQQIGRAMNAETQIETLQSNIPDIYASRLTLAPLGSQSWGRIEASSLQAALDVAAARSGVWKVPHIHVDTLQVDLRDIPPTAQTPPAEPAPPALPKKWWSRWLPTRTQVDEVRVQTFDLNPPPSGGVRVAALQISARPATDSGAWQLQGQGGTVTIPGRATFALHSAAARVDDRALVLHEGTAKWLGDSRVTARGELPFSGAKPWSFSGHVSNLDLRHLLDGAWSSRLSGVLEADYTVTAQSMKAKVRIQNGVAQNMAVLDRVADFTRTERFRRVVIDAASADVSRAGDMVKVTSLVLQSSGLIRIEGGFTLQNQQINGEFLVGVAPDTLRWIPGSQSRVFTGQRADAPGYVWTTVRISGPMDAPREDLSNRLLAAAGKALLIDTPLGVAESGLKAVGKTGEIGVQATKGAADVGKTVIGTGAEVIKGTGEAAGKVIETGVDILKGVVPILGK